MQVNPSTLQTTPNLPQLSPSQKTQNPSWKAKVQEIFSHLLKLPKISLTLPAINPFAFIKTESALQLDQDLIIKKLDNGLTYYVRKNDYPFPQKAYLRLVIRVGMLNETAEERGIAHLVEHITIIETDNFSKSEIRNYLSSIGIRWGADSNAYTTPEETTYKLDIPLDDPVTLEKCLFILSEIASHATLSNAIIEHEKEIVIDELTHKRDASARFHKARSAILYKDTPYINLLDRDNEIASVKKCPPEVVRKFYSRWYHPENMAVIAVGDFNEKKTCELIEKYFSKLPASSLPPSEHNINLEKDSGTQFLCYTDPEATYSYIEILHRLLPSDETNSISGIKKSILTSLFKRILKERLTNLEEQENSPFVQTMCLKGDLIADHPYFTLAAVTKQGEVSRAFNQLLLEIKRVKTHGFLQSELDDVKKTYLASLTHDILETGKTSSTNFIALCHSHFMKGELPLDDDKLVHLEKRLLAKITLKELNSLAADLLPESNRLISTSEPLRTDLKPVTEDILKEELSKASSIPVQPLVDDTVNQKLMKQLPKKGKIVSTKYHKKAKITEYTLNNGMKVYFKPTTFKNDEVLIRAQSIGGTIDADISKLASAKFSNDFYAAIGIGDLDLKTLNKILSHKSTTIGAKIGPYTSAIESNSVPENLESSFQLLHLMFTNPGYEEAAFKRTLANAKEVLRHEKNNPDTLFAHEVLSTITQKHPLFQPVTADNIGEVNYEDCKNFHQKQFSNPQNFNVAIVGNVKPHKVKQLVERYFASIPKNADKRTDFNFPAVPFPSGITRKVVHAGKETSCTSVITFPAPVKDVLKERMLSDWCCELLKKRLNNVLRFDLGKTYSQSCSFANTAIPGINPHNPSEAIISLTADAANLPLLEKALFEQIQDMQTNGPTVQEFNDLKKEKGRLFSDSKKMNSYWRDVILVKNLWNRQLDDIDDYKKELESVTISDTKEHFNKIFHLDNYAVVTLLPEKEKDES